MMIFKSRIKIILDTNRTSNCTSKMWSLFQSVINQTLIGFNVNFQSTTRAMNIFPVLDL